MSDTVEPKRINILGPQAMPFGPKLPGIRSRATLSALEKIRLEKENPGKLPIDYCLDVMRDENEDKELRLKAAAIAGRWLHPTLQAIKIEEKAQVQVQMTPEQLRGQILQLLIESGAIRADLLKPGISQGIASPMLDNDDDSD